MNPETNPDGIQDTVTLFSSTKDKNFSKIVASFQYDRLIIEYTRGGSEILQYMNVYDYTFSITIEKASVPNVYTLMGVQPDDKKELLQQLAAKFNTEDSYDNIAKLLTETQIEFEDYRLITPAF